MGGLVCACKLRQYGLRVLIIEKSATPGGCCNSFRAKEFEFDAFVHALGNLANGSQFNNLLSNLHLYEKANIVRFDPTDIILAPNLKIAFWNDYRKTLAEFKQCFPSEARQLDFFFNQILQLGGLDLVRLTRNKTFYQLLSEIFDNYELKKIFSVVILGNLGISSYLINAFTAVKHYQQFMIDGGYYPKNGVKVLPELLTAKFQELGGDVMFSTKVEKILIENGMASSIVLATGKEIKGKFIIANCDSRKIFLDMVGREHLSAKLINKVENMKPSLSLFVTYLGYSQISNSWPVDGVNNWVIDDFDYDVLHKTTINYESDAMNWLLIRSNYERKNCMLFTHAPYKDMQYWKENKRNYRNLMLSRARKCYPGLGTNLEYIGSADPTTIFNWTGNYRGAGYGWAATSEQFMDTDFTSDEIIRNLFICGHWSTVAQGVEGVSIVGEKIARKIRYRCA